MTIYPIQSINSENFKLVDCNDNVNPYFASIQADLLYRFDYDGLFPNNFYYVLEYPDCRVYYRLVISNNKMYCELYNVNMLDNSVESLEHFSNLLRNLCIHNKRFHKTAFPFIIHTGVLREDLLSRFSVLMNLPSVNYFDYLEFFKQYKFYKMTIFKCQYIGQIYKEN